MVTQSASQLMGGTTDVADMEKPPCNRFRNRESTTSSSPADGDAACRTGGLAWLVSLASEHSCTEELHFGGIAAGTVDPSRETRTQRRPERYDHDPSHRFSSDTFSSEARSGITSASLAAALPAVKRARDG